MINHCFVVLAYKESPYLENCINSVINQNNKSDVVIATSTLNSYIERLAEKYNIKVIENKSCGMGIGYDFDFARKCVDYDLVTIAHQDDEYDPNYSQMIIESYSSFPSSLILFSDYYEIREDIKEYVNTNLIIKRILLSSLRFKIMSSSKFMKRNCLRFGCSICCPAVTYVNKNIPFERIFDSNMKCNIDWFAWEKLSKVKGNFLYIPEKLMGHRIHEESTTTKIIGESVRTKEDLLMFKKFWPEFISKLISTFYKLSERSNKV